MVLGLEVALQAAGEQTCYFCRCCFHRLDCVGAVFAGGGLAFRTKRGMLWTLVLFGFVGMAVGLLP